MMTLLLAAAAATAPVPDLTRDPDLRCFMAVAYALGALPDEKDPAIEASLAAVMMYYVGKLDGRWPDIDLKKQVTRMIQLPSFRRALPAEMQRCGKEAEDRGAALQDFGQYLQGIAPLLDSRPG